MKISLYKRKNRSSKGSARLDLYMMHTLPKGKQKKVRLKGHFLYIRPRTTAQTNHNSNTQYEVNQIIAKAQKEQRLGYYDIEDYSREPESVVIWCEQYIETLSTKIKTKSISPYVKVTKLFKEFFGEERTFADITLQDAEKFKALLMNGTVNRYRRQYKTNTVNTYLNRMSLMFEEAMKRGNQTHKRINVFKEVGNWKVDKKIKPYINLEEYQMLDENMCICKPIARGFKFSILTGLRTGDIQALRWKDIQKDVKGWFMYVNMQKTGEPIRVSLTDEHLKVLGERGQEEEIIFDFSMSNEEYMYFYSWIHNTFNGTKAVKEVNNGITFHSGRASFITNMLMNGVPAVRVMTYVGHADLKTTLSYYRGSTEMQEEDMNSYISSLRAYKGVLKAKQLLS